MWLPVNISYDLSNRIKASFLLLCLIAYIMSFNFIICPCRIVWIQPVFSNTCPLVSIWTIITTSCHLRFGLSSGCILPGFPAKILYELIVYSTSHTYWFDGSTFFYEQDYSLGSYHFLVPATYWCGENPLFEISAAGKKGLRHATKGALDGFDKSSIRRNFDTMKKKGTPLIHIYRKLIDGLEFSRKSENWGKSWGRRVNRRRNNWGRL